MQPGVDSLNVAAAAAVAFYAAGQANMPRPGWSDPGARVMEGRGSKPHEHGQAQMPRPG
jgi:hypothetical protein